MSDEHSNENKFQNITAEEKSWEFLTKGVCPNARDEIKKNM